MSSQNIIDEMIMSLPRSEQVIVKRLRALIQDCLPMATEKAYYDWRVPFYTHHRLICFIWPSSLPGEPKKGAPKEKVSRVSLGFCQGNLMSNEDGVLLSEKRKQVYVMYFHSLNEIKEDQVRALLFEAGMIDDGFGEKKKAKKK